MSKEVHIQPDGEAGKILNPEVTEPAVETITEDPADLLAQEIEALKKQKEAVAAQKAAEIDRLATEVIALSDKLLSTVVPVEKHVAIEGLGNMLPSYKEELDKLKRAEQSELAKLEADRGRIEGEKNRLDSMLKEAEGYNLTGERVDRARAQLKIKLDWLLGYETSHDSIVGAKKSQQQALVAKWQAEAREQALIAADPFKYATETLLKKQKEPGIAEDEVLTRVATIRQEQSVKNAEATAEKYQQGVATAYEKLVQDISNTISVNGAEVLREYSSWKEALQGVGGTAEQYGLLPDFRLNVAEYRRLATTEYSRFNPKRSSNMAADEAKMRIIAKHVSQLFDQLPFGRNADQEFQNAKQAFEEALTQAKKGTTFEVSTPTGGTQTVYSNAGVPQSFIFKLKIDRPDVLAKISSIANELETNRNTWENVVKEREVELKALVRTKMASLAEDLPELAPRWW